MQNFNTPVSLDLPFITIHFLANLTAENIKSIDDVPHTRLVLVNLHTAQKVDLYLRFDLKVFKLRALDATRAKQMLFEGIQSAINAVNYTLPEGACDAPQYRNEIFEIHSHPSLIRLPSDKPVTTEETLDALWKSIGRLAQDHEMRSHEQNNSFGRYIDSNNEMVYGIKIYLGNFISVQFFKPEKAIPLQFNTHEGELTGFAHVMKSSGYRFRVTHSLWHDRGSYQGAMQFIPHGEIIQRVQKGVKMIFNELPLAETDLASIVSDMVFDK